LIFRCSEFAAIRNRKALMKTAQFFLTSVFMLCSLGLNAQPSDQAVGLGTPIVPVEHSADQVLLPGEIPQSSVLWKYPHTPFKVRFAISVGDHAGGPIRFNTHFPEVKSDPHPASYYHGLANLGGEVEYALKWGGVMLGAQMRKDLWHPGIKGRIATVGSDQWSIDDFAVNSTGLVAGWVFGERYREVPWTTDLAFVYDRANADVTFSNSSQTSVMGQVNMEVLALRCRFHFNSTSSRGLGFSAGPDLHFPIWSAVSDRSDEVLNGWVGEYLELKTAAALGFSAMTSYRF